MFNSYTNNTLRLNTERCNGCAVCTEVCPHGVFSLENHRAQLARAERCMECGACALNCSQGAITVESGVGCATAMMIAALRGTTEVGCG